MLLILVQVPGPITDAPLDGPLARHPHRGSAMLYLLIWIDPEEPSQSFARQVAISKSYHVREHRILETCDVCVHVWVNGEHLTTPEA
jgi:hypothetical protein